MADPMWLLVMFDLPVVSKEQRGAANAYRNLLYDRGFSQVQFSVYAKYLVNATGVRALLPELRFSIPAEGEVRILRLTDEQWAGMYRFFGPAEVPVEDRPTQLVIFSDEIVAEPAAGPLGRDRTGRKPQASTRQTSDAAQQIQGTLPLT